MKSLRSALLLTLAVCSAMIVQAQETAPQACFTIRADWFDRGNVRISTVGQIYADKFACIWNGGPLPNTAEYDLDFPVTADYTLVALYTAAGSRPIDIYLDGEKIHQGFASVTGSWQTAAAQWETQCAMRIPQGRHTLKLICPGPCMCHVSALRLESSQPFPEGWKLDRPDVRRASQAAPRPTVTAADAHLVPAVAGIGLGEAIVEEVQWNVEAAAVDSPIGPLENNELALEADEVGLTPTGRLARLRLRTSDGLSVSADVEISPEGVRRMLTRSIELIDDYRTLDGSPRDLLHQARASAVEMAAQLEPLVDTTDAVARLFVQASQLEHRVALANPLLDFERLLLVKRRLASGDHGYGGDPWALPCNWQSNSSIRNDVWDNEICVAKCFDGEAWFSTLYRPAADHFVGDVDLAFDGDRLLFSSVGEGGRWHVFEIGADGQGLRQVTTDLGDVHNYDACYLPDDRIIFSSTASMAAVPCVNGSSLVANTYRMDADGSNVRQLCFDQEHNWCPTVMPDGKVLYLRWEYTDTPHSHDRILFQMNPDGTGQMEFYGANSYWPNSLFYARPIPGAATKFVGIVSGHHGARRMGELVLFDSARGHHEADGVVQRIPGRGRPVEPLIEDNLVDNSWPKFLHPYPLSENYILVAAQPTAKSAWGIYLVDTFDNMTLLAEAPGYSLFEPIPLRATPKPPVIPDRIDPDKKDAVVYLADVYAGAPMKDIPRGTVKRLRIVGYHFLYPGMGGPQGVVGMEGPWDIKRIIGTVPVAADGSATFRIPANTPVTVQPLDADGKAVQLMRSWFTGMPGEVVSCAGCHENRNTGPAADATADEYRHVDEITPWYGPARGFNFAREVQPVLDRYCVGCHDGQADDAQRSIADLRGHEAISDYTSAYHFGAHDAGHFSTSYVELHRFVRRPGLESDYHILNPMEFHADTTQIVQLLSRGHYNVRLDAEAWDRLITWIDLNAPFHGTWSEIAGSQRVEALAKRRMELNRLFGGPDEDPEAIWVRDTGPIEPILPEAAPTVNATPVDCPDWPFNAEDALRRQQADGPIARAVELPGGSRIELVRIPAGQFVMGDASGELNERPASRMSIERSFWMATCEVTNEQFADFDPGHDSRVESRFGMQFGVRGFYVNGPDQPVVRVSWERAVAFCEWLSRETSLRFSLPTEAQWEYACRAGTETPFWYGDLDTDFAPFANLADSTLSEFVCHPYQKDRQPLENRSKYDDWIPKDARFRDGGFLSDTTAAHQSNAWGLYDMHGNVWEWTRSAPYDYPYQANDGRNGATNSTDRRVVRGGSWRDRPERSRSASRLAYRPYQGVYNVGFRVVCEEESDALAASQ